MNISPINNISFGKRTNENNNNITRRTYRGKQNGIDGILDVYNAVITDLKNVEKEISEEEKKIPKDEAKIKELKTLQKSYEQNKIELNNIIKAISNAKDGDCFVVRITESDLPS